MSQGIGDLRFGFTSKNHFLSSVLSTTIRPGGEMKPPISSVTFKLCQLRGCGLWVAWSP